MAITKISRGLLSTGISDSSDATAITIDSSENTTFGGDITVSGSSPEVTFQTGASHYNWQIAAQENLSSALEISVGSADADASNDTFSPKIYVKQAGDVEITDGNLVVASGHGIDFSATGDASGMGSELLDDYEEGTWTATLTLGGNSVGLTYSVRTGYYMKVGRIVTATLYVLLTNKGSSTGQLILSGLPYTALGSNAYAAASLHLSVVSFSGFPQAYVVNGSTLAYFGQTADSGTFTQLTNSNISNNTGIIFTVTYQTT